MPGPGAWQDEVVPATPDELVRDFLAALVSRDLDAACAMVTPDFEYDNVPIGKSFGPEGLRSTLEGFFSMLSGIDWQIVRQTSSGDTTHGTVLNERDDRVEIHGRWASLPVAGVFEVRNGFISLWRDYFDKTTLFDLMSPPPAES